MEKGNFITSSELKVERIKGCPIKVNNMLIYDKLEEQGILKMHEYIGGCVYLEPEFLEKGAPPVAEISISRSGDSLMLQKLFFEYGHEELLPVMMEQIKHFADFYGYSMPFRDLRKNRKSSIMTGNAI